MKAFCDACMIQLTPELIEYTDDVNLDMPDGHCYIPKGYYKICDGTWGYEEEKGQIVINIEDLINAVNHSSGRRMSGCCGPSGINDPNKLCKNGHEVATEHSDCWQPWSTVFGNLAIIIK